MPNKKPKKELAIFILTKKLKEQLRKEAFRLKRSRSDIVREALYLYFSK